MSKTKSKATSKKTSAVSLEVGEKGIRVSADGDGGGRLAQALADLISPLTEGAAYFGDVIRFRRINTSIKALSKAHEIAKERGLELKPVGSKFLIEWLEKSSIEDENDDELMTLWAKLLASASEDPNAAKVSYIDFLRKLNKDDAKLIQFLAFDTNFEFSKNFYKLKDFSNFLETAEKNIVKFMQKKKEVSYTEILEYLDGAALQANLRLIYISREASLVMPTELYQKHELSISMLEREGAIKLNFGEIHVGSETIQMCWLELTKFGFDFVRACEGALSEAVEDK